MTSEQKIIPCIWCNANADEVVEFYLSVFADSPGNTTEIRRSHYPSEGLADFQQSMAGKTLTIDFSVGGVRLMALNAGSEFTPNPSLSFIVNFDPSVDAEAEAHLDATWQRLSDGGTTLMPLDAYPFSKRYGWVQDKFGVSWQLMLTDPGGDPRPFVVPSLMFANDNVNRAREALEFYASVFPDSQVGTVATYPVAQDRVEEGAVMFADFRAGGQWLAVMDSPMPQDFTFNEGVSLLVECADQAEIDHYWAELSHVPEAEVCGWCKDQFGVSWQVAPATVDELLSGHGFAAMMQMTKIVIADLSAPATG